MGLCFWIEEKAASLRKDPFRDDLESEDADPSWASPYFIRSHLKQLRKQANFAFRTYPGPGFYSFLIIGNRFTLFYFPRPPQSNAATADGNFGDETVVAMEEVQDLEPMDPFDIAPKVFHTDRPMYNADKTDFSPQLLDAFERISRLNPAIAYDIEIQPSMFRPRPDVVNTPIPTTRREHMLQEIFQTLDDEPESPASATLSAGIPTPDNKKADPTFRSRAKLSGASPRRTRSRANLPILVLSGTPVAPSVTAGAPGVVDDGEQSPNVAQPGLEEDPDDFDNESYAPESPMIGQLILSEATDVL
ncbi:hypothetical protein BC834DRAFT_862838 [Gloeopeniophorella convolvens]|nr:hypothetical protein BC834DRAFT_862838 [Gloeopeniophorella convolvens]